MRNSEHILCGDVDLDQNSLINAPEVLGRQIFKNSRIFHRETGIVTTKCAASARMCLEITASAIG